MNFSVVLILVMLCVCGLAQANIDIDDSSVSYEKFELDTEDGPTDLLTPSNEGCTSLSRLVI